MIIRVQICLIHVGSTALTMRNIESTESLGSQQQTFWHNLLLAAAARQSTGGQEMLNAPSNRHAVTWLRSYMSDIASLLGGGDKRAVAWLSARDSAEFSHFQMTVASVADAISPLGQDVAYN